MAGHSQFKNIMHRKGRQDAVRAKIFTKVGREIAVAAKLGGGDPAFNPRLRAAVAEARANNMPNDRIKRAIDSALGGGDGANYESVRYEGFGPGNVAVIVDGLTDNRTRTATDMRTIFSKKGGNLGAENSVAYMFDRVGRIVYPKTAASDDAMFEAALEAGADNVEQDGDQHVILTKVEAFAAARDTLESKFGPAEKAGLVWQPNMTVAVAGETAEALLAFLDALEDNDDVQNVTCNADISEDVLKKMEG